jgi:16S rRNA (cytidine1402-2'-O)-methyltransferase
MTENKKGVLYLIPIELALGTGKATLGKKLKDIIQSVDFFAVENIRTARRFISSLSLGIDISTLQFHELHNKTHETVLDTLIGKILKGQSCGVMSEAGCPGIADPGSRMAAIAHQRNIQVVPLVGPSSFIMALMASGLNGQKFTFHGYIPIDKASRLKAIEEIENRSITFGEAQIFMETPYRNEALLNDIISQCKNNTMLCVASDITGENEFIKTLQIAQWRNKSVKINKIPTVFILQA